MSATSHPAGPVPPAPAASDERLVPMDDERSNVRAIAKAFLPVGARVIPIATEIADYKLAGGSAESVAPIAICASGWAPR